MNAKSFLWPRLAGNLKMCVDLYTDCIVQHSNSSRDVVDKSSKEDWQSITLISAGPQTSTARLQCQTNYPPARLPSCA